MNNEDIELESLFDDEIPFKAVTKGLGFHHTPKESAQQPDTLQSRSKSLEASFNQRAAKVQKAQEPKAMSAREMGDLAPFYSSKEEETIELKLEQEIKIEETVAQASLASRLFAFSVDIVIIFCALGLMFLSVLIAADISLMFVRENLQSEVFLTSAVPMAALFYFFYFSFFDKTAFSSPGKKIVGIGVESTVAERVKMSQAFMRSLIVLVSALSLGMISVLDLQSKLTETKVVKK